MRPPVRRPVPDCCSGTPEVRGSTRSAKRRSSWAPSASWLAARRSSPALIKHLEAGVGSREEPEGVTGAGSDADDNTDEAFVTALVLDIPDGEPQVRFVNCGHPPPLLLRAGQVIPLDAGDASPPLGLSDVLSSEATVDTFPFDVGDVLLLYTDGVVEARDESRAFYPLTERLMAWVGDDPSTLLGRLRADLQAYVGGHLGDDAALVAIERLEPTP